MPSDFVTLEVLKELLAVQERAYRTLIESLLDNIKQDVRDLRNEVVDLKQSTTFTSAKYDHITSEISRIDRQLPKVDFQLRKIEEDNSESFTYLEDRYEYLESQSRRNNVKILGLPEYEDEISWDATEAKVKEQIKTALGIEDNLVIEHAHRTRRSSNNRSSGGFGQIVCLEASLREETSRNYVCCYFSKRTLDKRRSKIPDLLEARKAGKTAYFVMDKLVVRSNDASSFKGHRKKELNINQGATERTELSTATDDDDPEVILNVAP
eukprot:Seg924.21 transcript_id=Seg924.21/GoldUCD/mRNA.D3Y31 product="hypothetical protein" protein_id=Seg924.21/GoldUCD/D3Y31